MNAAARLILLLTILYLPPLSANPSTGLHSVSSTPLCQSLHGLHSVSSIPLCQSLHWPPLSVLHPSLPIPPLTSTQCSPSLSTNPSTGLQSVSSTPLCQSLHWPPFSVLVMPIPPLASIQCPPSTPLCQSLHWPPFSVLHPFSDPPLTSTQCSPPLSANPSTGLHSVSSTP
ncbi:unnamed protein product, partial [Staurois parvus]